MDFYFTDVFGTGRYSGNQLATFLHCGHLGDTEMQQIAREVNFSESTFVLSDQPNNGGYDVRIFTPHQEIPFAGHPTLGTAFVIREQLLRHPAQEVILNLGVGPIAVRFSSGDGAAMLWMQQRPPSFGDTLDPQRLARVLGLESRAVDVRWPIEEVSTGLPHIVVPLRDLDALHRAAIDKSHYKSLVADTWAKAVLAFCPEGYTDEQALGVRMFADYYGVPEDPATGSGNGCLAAYLVKHRYFGASTVDIRVGQGYEIGRPSLLALRAREIDARIEVAVGGRVIPVAHGQWA